MKTILSLFTIIFLICATGNAQVRMNADIEETTLSWLGEKVLGKHTGTIILKGGWLDWDGQRILAGEFTIDMTSIKDSDGSVRLESHLKSEDFFGVEKFPVSKLVLTGSDPFDKGSAVVRGNLTIKGITNPVEFKAAVQTKDGGTWFYAKIIIDRTKYNVRYGSGSFFSNLGDSTIFDEFEVKVNLLVK
ncbi:MAG: YceI family protein [Bacteroidales bacterium]|nr:YceI family protein [Bacteroidales bacterium]